MQIDEEKWIEANSVIISTGASAMAGSARRTTLKWNGRERMCSMRWFFFKGKEVAIVGAGDTAAEEALYLSKLCTKVHMLIRKSEMRASKIMQDRVLNSPTLLFTGIPKPKMWLEKKCGRRKNLQ